MNTLVSISTIISGLAALLAVILAFFVFRKQTNLIKEIHDDQKLLNQRQFIIPLWKYLSGLTEIDPQKPITPHIVEALNALELVAICCEGKMVDEKVILRTFKDQFVKHYESIMACKKVEGYKSDTSGEQLIKENKATMQFYDRLVELDKNYNRLN